MNYERFQHTTPHSKNIFLIDMTKETDVYISQAMDQSITKALQNKEHILIIHNKKGYASGIMCTKCGYIPNCSNCSVPISYHQTINKDMIGLCHICKKQYNLPTTCPHCQSTQISLYGIGIQQLANKIQQQYNTIPLTIDAQQVNSPKKITQIQKEIPKHPIIIATAILSQPWYQPNLIIVTQADIGLNIPDYSSQYKNFLFLYEIFTKYHAPHFVVQSFKINEASIRLACKLDLTNYLHHENTYRQQYQYPPYSDICVILYKHETEKTLHNKIDKLHKEILYLKEKYELSELEIYTTPPLVYKMFGKYRYNIICKWPQLKNFIDIIYSKLQLNSRGFKIDRDAQSII